MAKLTTLEGLDMQNPYVKYGLIAAAGIGVYMLMKKSGGLSGLKDSTIGSRELVLYIENDEPLNRQINAVIKNLHKKHKKGTFDHEKSLIAWKHVVDEGVKRYAKEFGTTTKVFDSTDRKEAAKELAKDFADDIKIGLDEGLSGWKHAKNREGGVDRVGGQRIKCYHNKKWEYEPYTVVYLDQPWGDAYKSYESIGMSGDGSYAHGAAQLGTHLGKRIKFSELPEGCQKTVRMDLTGEGLSGTKGGPTKIKLKHSRKH